MNSRWHHSPLHIFVPESTYMVTGGTLYKVHYFEGGEWLNFLQDSLLELIEKHNWLVQAWAVFVNHYHFIAQALESATPISRLIQELHSKTAIEVNKRDGVRGRQIWFQYWDTRLTYENSWLTRLNYVNNNAVHHGLVRVADQYPYCSAGWFQREAPPAFQKKLASFKYDRLKIRDDF